MYLSAICTKKQSNVIRPAHTIVPKIPIGTASAKAVSVSSPPTIAYAVPNTPASPISAGILPPADINPK